MRLSTTLVNIAVIASAACGGSEAPTASGGKDASAGSSTSSGADASSGGSESGTPESGSSTSSSSSGSSGSGSTSSGGCGPVPTATASPAQACAIAQMGPITGEGAVCEALCRALDGGDPNANYSCDLPQPYLAAYAMAVGDGGIVEDGGDGGYVTCPAWTGDLVVQCDSCIGGRSTDGLSLPEGCDGATTGVILAERAYLEAVSVHAFARLERELAANGAPPSLVRDARRARRDELRHTAMMGRLASRYGATARAPVTPSSWPQRSLFAIALENAVEGCVRETYGAVVGLVEARLSRDPAVRRTMQRIAEDECRHAELASAVADGIRPRLTADERDAVERAMRDAVAALAAEGDSRIVGLLAARVWAS